MDPTIIAETDDYFVINKPAGMATEPPSPKLTLSDWLVKQQHINPAEWGSDDRLGIVHRLDTDTSGVILWAKTKNSQDQLRELWQGRVVQKKYFALVTGKAEPEGTVELSLERDNQNDRQRVALLPTTKSRPAITRYKTLAHGAVGEWEVSLLELHPITGRTHQIRVHCKAIGHPLIGDTLYGEKSSTEIARLVGLERQFLHAHSLKLPDTDLYVAPLPQDLVNCLQRSGVANPDESVQHD